MATSVSGATKFFPKPQEGFTTTASGTVNSGATTVGLNSTGNYSNGDTVVLIVDPGVSGKEQSFTGVIDTSGVQVTGVVWTSGTNVAHSSGATVVDYVAAAHLQLITAGILVSHNIDGTPKTGVTYPASTFTTPTITDFTNATHTHASSAQGGSLNGANAITDGTITPAELTSGTGSSWAWQTWVPTVANLSGGTTTAVYIQIGKTVFFRIRYVFAGADLTSNPTFTYPVTPISGELFDDIVLGTGNLIDTGNNNFMCSITNSTADTIIVRGMTTNGSILNLTTTVPFTWGAGDVISARGHYEAA